MKTFDKLDNSSENDESVKEIRGNKLHHRILGFFFLVVGGIIIGSPSLNSGGLTNHLFLCTLPGEANPVMVRMYGDIFYKNTYFMVQEAVVFAILSERGVSPRLMGVFEGGRIEEFITHTRTVTTLEIAQADMYRRVTRQFAAIHRLDMPISRNPYLMFDTARRYHLELNLSTGDSSVQEVLTQYDVMSELDWLE